MTTIPSKRINTAGTLVAFLRTVPSSTKIDIPDLVHADGVLRLKKAAKVKAKPKPVKAAE